MKGTKLRALLIEDDPADHQLISRSLRKSHAATELVWVKQLNEGLKRIDDEHFDVVLTDLSLPDSFGLETVKNLRKQNSTIPIIVLTTLDDVEVELTSLTVGAQDYLIKDEATPHTLERAIHHAIQRQESIVEHQRLLAKVKSSRQLLAQQQKLLKKKNRRLRRLYRTAHRFVDDVSHEFRTPLTVIKDYVSLVREGLVGDVNDEQRRMLDTVGVRADDLNNMVDDMLDVSKLKSGLIGAWRRPYGLADIVESVCPPLARKAAVKNIAFDVDIDPQLPMLYCDPEKVGRVIINLVTNAMKFCGDPGQVRLFAHLNEHRQEVAISVSDDGAGIEKDAVNKIFKRFKQLKTCLKHSTKGFGLGLNIAKELVDLNFGEMSVESRLGEGTTFTFTIPVNDPASVMSRFLRRAQVMPPEQSGLALVTARIDKSLADGEAADADAFLNYLLRRNDLLFNTGRHEWLFVLAVPRMELPNFLKRAREEWTKTNRNRPFGPLPEIDMHVEGIWNPCTESAAILESFSAQLNRDTANVEHETACA